MGGASHSLGGHLEAFHINKTSPNLLYKEQSLENGMAEFCNFGYKRLPSKTAVVNRHGYFHHSLEPHSSLLFHIQVGVQNIVGGPYPEISSLKFDQSDKET